MLPSLPLALFAVFTFAGYIGWGAMVRRGTIRDTGIIWTGLVLGIVSMLAYAAILWPEYNARHYPFSAVLVAIMPMGWLSLFCIIFSYRSQRVQEIDVHSIGDTKIIVRVAGPNRFPDAQAMLLPISTSLRMNDGIAGMVALGAGRDVQHELNSLGPVGMGKVVQTGGGTTGTGRIFHVAVADSTRPVDADRLRKGMESAAQQARKAGTESLVIPLGPMRGLSTEAVTLSIVTGVLKQRKAFAEIVFQVLDARQSNVVKGVIANAIEALDSAGKAGSLSS